MPTDPLPDQSWRPTPSVLAKIADELRHNDECGSREPLSDDEYMDDARALFRIFTDHKADELDRLRTENERLAVAVHDWQGHTTTAQEQADRFREDLVGVIETAYRALSNCDIEARDNWKWVREAREILRGALNGSPASDDTEAKP